MCGNQRNSVVVSSAKQIYTPPPTQPDSEQTEPVDFSTAAGHEPGDQRVMPDMASGPHMLTPSPQSSPLDCPPPPPPPPYPPQAPQHRMMASPAEYVQEK